jgi:hypothetical protein
MTDVDKLKQLFEAALKDSSPVTKPLERAFPTSRSMAAPALAPGPLFQPAPVPETVPVQQIEVE